MKFVCFVEKNSVNLGCDFLMIWSCSGLNDHFIAASFSTNNFNHTDNNMGKNWDENT